jgi:hypothetical protein
VSTENLTVASAADGGAAEQTDPTPRRTELPPIREFLRFVIPTLVLLGTFALLTNHAKDRLTNTDTYFHLRFGHEFLHGAWSLGDPGTVTTFGTAHWVPTQWLTQVVMAQLEDWFGLAGVAWLSGLMFLTFVFTLWSVARHYANPTGAVAVTVVAVIASAPSMSMRPQVLSYVFVAITTYAWIRTREDGRARWWLVPLTWLWAMVHGMWSIGLVIGVVALLGLALDRAAPVRQWLRLAAVPLLSAVAAALTPVGPRLYSAVLEVNSRGHYFSEWQPPNFRNGNCIALLLLLGLVLLRWSRRPTSSSWTEVVLVVLGLGWALYTQRTVTVAAMMLVPFAAMATQDPMKVFYPRLRRENLAVVVGALTCLAVLAVLVPRTADEPRPEPRWNATTLADLPDGTKDINDWGQGGYLMWRFPELDFMMNGYGDLFTDSELERNYQLDAALPGWDETVRRTGADYALLAPGSRLAYNLRHTQQWTIVESAPDIELLRAPQ